MVLHDDKDIVFAWGIAVTDSTSGVSRPSPSARMGIDQVKLVMDDAAAQEVFATRQQLGEEVIGYAHTIKVRALARLSELLRDLEKAVGARAFRAKRKRALMEPRSSTPNTTG